MRWGEPGEFRDSLEGFLGSAVFKLTRVCWALGPEGCGCLCVSGKCIGSECW